MKTLVKPHPVLVQASTFVGPDEPALGLVEKDVQSPGNRGLHRYRVVTVIRGDKPVEIWQDKGPSGAAKHEPFGIPGGVIDHITGRIYIEHTAGELIDIADQLADRENTALQQQTSDLIGGYHAIMERRQQALKRG